MGNDVFCFWAGLSFRRDEPAEVPVDGEEAIAAVAGGVSVLWRCRPPNYSSTGEADQTIRSRPVAKGTRLAHERSLKVVLKFRQAAGALGKSCSKVFDGLEQRIGLRAGRRIN